MLPLILPILNWFGSGPLVLLKEHFDKKMDNATEQQKAKYNYRLGLVNAQIARNEIQKDANAKDAEHWLLWVPKFTLFMAVSVYYSSIYLYSTLALNSKYGIIIDKVPDGVEPIGLSVVAYWTLDKVTKRFVK